MQRYSITKMTHVLVKNKLSQALIYLRGPERESGKEAQVGRGERGGEGVRGRGRNEIGRRVGRKGN